jgi:hypothetical protein
MFKPSHHLIGFSLGFVILSSTPLVCAQTTQNEYYSYGLPASVVANLTWTHDAVTINQSYLDTLIKPSLAQWNGISTKVKSTYVAPSATPTKLKVFLGNQGSSGQDAGETVPYCAVGTGYGVCAISRTQGSTYTSVRIYGYDNAMNGAGYNNTNKIKMFTHEVGHALSMDHFDRTDLPSTTSVMVSGKYLHGVQAYDKTNLKLKWGN